MLPQTGRRCGEVFRERLELIPTIFVVLEHVETCESRAEQNLVATISEFRGATDSFGQRGAARMGQAKCRAMKRQLPARLANQDEMFHAWRDSVHKSREVPALRFATGDQDHRRAEPGQSRFDRVKIRRFG